MPDTTITTTPPGDLERRRDHATRRAFDDLLQSGVPFTPQRESADERIRRIRAEIEAGQYLTEQRIRGAINKLWQEVREGS